MNLILNNQTLSDNELIINLPENHNRITLFYNTSLNGADSFATNGVQYTVDYKPAKSDIWFPLKASNGNNVTGALAAAGTEVQDVLELSTGESVRGGLTYRINITSDEDPISSVTCSLDTSYVNPNTMVDPSGLLVSGFHQIKNSNDNAGSDGWTYTGFPDISSMGLTLVDLSVDDPNFPVGENVKYAMLYCVAGITSNGSNVADVETTAIVSTPTVDETSINTNPGKTYNSNVKGRAGNAQDDQDINLLIVEMVNNKIAVGLNTVEEVGSNAFGNINVIGYVK